MSDTTKLPAPAGPASAFVASTELPWDIWAKAGHAIELAYCSPPPMSLTVRIAAAALALVVAAKLCAPGVMQ